MARISDDASEASARIRSRRGELFFDCVEIAAQLSRERLEGFRELGPEQVGGGNSPRLLPGRLLRGLLSRRLLLRRLLGGGFLACGRLSSGHVEVSFLLDRSASVSQ